MIRILQEIRRGYISGAALKFMEGDVFRTIIPLKPQDGKQANEQGDDGTKKILKFCRTARSRSEI